MPILTDPRAEAFAHARARGANLEDAYDRAGFAGGYGHATRYARRPKVAARIRELIEAGGRHSVTGQDIALELQRMVRHAADFDSPELMRETRVTLMELRKVQLDLDHQRALELNKAQQTRQETARNRPKPPVSARISRAGEQTALPPQAKAAAIATSPHRAALTFAASPLTILAVGASTPGAASVSAAGQPALAASPPRLLAG